MRAILAVGLAAADEPTDCVDDLARVPDDDTRPVVVAMLAEVCACRRSGPPARREVETLAMRSPMGACLRLGPVDRLLANLDSHLDDLPLARERMSATLTPESVARARDSSPSAQ